MGLTQVRFPVAAPTPSDILGFACMRDERLRLPWFLGYHRAIGVDRFHVVDNGSTDGTLEFLQRQPDVALWSTNDSYAGSACGMEWLNALLAEYAPGHWALTLDADEQLVYPGSEFASLRTLTAYLEAQGANALQTMMIDMYSDGPIHAATYRSGEPFLDACRYFDGDTYPFLLTENDLSSGDFRGGPRARAFWEGREREQRAPYLGKVPLVKWTSGCRYLASTHRIDIDRIAVETGLLLHFKYFSDFLERVPSEVERNEHFDNASEYRAYLEVLREQTELSLHYNGAVEFECTHQMVRLGFMRSSPEWDALSFRDEGAPSV